MAGYTIEIECMEDGTYVCSKEPTEPEDGMAGGGVEAEGPEAPEAPGETFTDPKQVLGWVRQALSDSVDPKTAWDQEAAKRYGQAAPRGPAMTM